jgi:uncharacterized protein (DUF2147 family)
MRKNILIVLTFLISFALEAQTPIGVWKTIDDETGEAKSHVQIYEENGKLHGKVIAFLRKNVDPNRVCNKCSDWRKGQKIMQMIILRDMQLKDGFYKNGKILDPEKGKEYSCSMWLESNNPNVLKLRGYIGISALGRSQTWHRVQ